MKIIETLRALGYTFQIQDGAIRYKFNHTNPPPQAGDLLAEVKNNKLTVISYLNIPWPPACLASERSFGHGPARLYPFLEKTVATPQGLGRLWQVGTDQVGVVLREKPGKVTFISWYDVRPVDQNKGENL